VTWLESFLWTCALETPVYVLLLRNSFRRWWAPVAISLGLQLATHPLLWVLFPRNGPYWTAFFLFELGVALAEGGLVALLLRRIGERRPLLRGMLSGLLANTLSATIGLLLASGSGRGPF
jgi:hypothetical protein